MIVNYIGLFCPLVYCRLISSGWHFHGLFLGFDYYLRFCLLHPAVSLDAIVDCIGYCIASHLVWFTGIGFVAFLLGHVRLSGLNLTHLVRFNLDLSAWAWLALPTGQGHHHRLVFCSSSRRQEAPVSCGLLNPMVLQPIVDVKLSGLNLAHLVRFD